MKTMRVFGLTVTAAVMALAMTGAESQQASNYRHPPLSAPRYQYYQQHPDEFQNLLKRFPALPQVEAPGNHLPESAANEKRAPGETPVSSGTWTSVTNAGVALMNPILLTDGTVIAHTSCDTLWYKLTPALVGGNYAGGSWTQIANTTSMGYGPRFFGSGVLPDGRVITEGGEYNGTGGNCGNRTTLGAIYNPATNTWAAVSPPSGWTTISDAAGIILPNGTYMQTSCCDFGKAALLNPSTLAWTATGTNKFDVYDEEAMAQTSNGKILTVDAYVGTGTCGKGTEIYDPSTGAWSSAGNVPNQQSDCNSNFPSFEVGPLVMRPNGTAVTFSGLTTGVAGTAIYTVSNGTWAAGPNLPAVCNSTQCTLADAPGAVLPNGNILFAASPGNWTSSEQFPAGIAWFEMSIADNSITQVNSKADSGSGFGAWEENLLVLPNGQILAMTIDGTTTQVYTPATGQNAAYAPTVTSYPTCVNPGSTYTASGIQFNGLTEGAYYGDDVQGSTNYPIVVIYNQTSGAWYFAKTFNHSNRSIVPGVSSSTSFTVPAGTSTSGASSFYVIANGVASAAQPITVQSAACPTVSASHDFNGDGKSDILWRDTSGNLAMWLMNGGTVSSSLAVASVPTNWTVYGQRDFNGDGKSDILWHDSSGNVAIWLMNGGTVSSSIAVGNVATNWSIAGTGDFNGDGKGDIVWRDNAGNVAIWLMNGGTVSTSAVVANVPTSWTIQGASGKGILWRDNSGNTALWIMNGTTVSQSISLGNVPTSWSIVGSGDFNGDGNIDILWHNVSGDTAIWFLNASGAVTSSAFVANVGTTWSIWETGDFNGDGKSDILWRDLSGNTAIWLMNGGSVSSSISLGNVSTSWSIQSYAAD